MTTTTYILNVREIGDNLEYATLAEAEAQRVIDIESAVEMGYTRERAEELITIEEKE